MDGEWQSDMGTIEMLKFDAVAKFISATVLFRIMQGSAQPVS